MSRKKSDHELWQHKFYLSSDIPVDVEIHKHLRTLADADKAGLWIREALQNWYHSSTTVVPHLTNSSTTVVPSKEIEARQVDGLDKPAQPKGYIPSRATFTPVPKPGQAKKPTVRRLPVEDDTFDPDF